MDETEPYFPVGLGVEVRESDPHNQEITHPINYKMDYSLHRRSLGPHEAQKLGPGTALVPHYREDGQTFPFRNSSSIPDMIMACYTSPSPRDTHMSFDFSAHEHEQMGMDPHSHVVASPHIPELTPGLSTDSSSLSEMSDSAVLSPMPHPLGSRLNLWHTVNNSQRQAPGGVGGEDDLTPALVSPVPPVMAPPHSADDTIDSKRLEYTRKKRLRHPSLIRTPHTVCTQDWEEAFNENNLAWERGRHEPDQGLLLPGLPKLPTFPTEALIVDNVPCDLWGRKQCTTKVATALISVCTLFPPFWLLIGAGFCDDLVGVVPRTAKLVSFGLGGATLTAMIVLVICLCVL